MSETLKEPLAQPEQSPDLLNYEASPDDITRLREGIELLRSQHLLEEETLKGLRFVTFDAQHIYVISEEEHHEVEGIALEELPMQNGMHIYKIPSRHLGSSERSYRGAGAWLELHEIEQTAGNATRVLNPKIGDQKLKQEILKVVFAAPSDAFAVLNTKGTDYASGMIAHEAAHIEEMRYRDWPNEGSISPFPNKQREEEFGEIVRSGSSVPPDLAEKILNMVDRATMGELYAIAVERESLRRSHKDDKTRLAEYFQELTNEKVSFDDAHIIELLSSSHIKAYVLAHALEEVFPDYQERMAKLRELITTPKEE